MFYKKNPCVDFYFYLKNFGWGKGDDGEDISHLKEALLIFIF
jgi:hypothetical protein